MDIGDSTDFLKEADQNAKNFTVAFTFCLPIVNTISMFSVATMSFAYCYLKNDLEDATCLYEPFKVQLPWDQSTVFFGWVFEVIFSFHIAAAYLFMIFTFVSFFVGFSMHCRAYRKYFQTILKKMGMSTSNKIYEESSRRLCTVIRFHNTTRRYFFLSLFFNNGNIDEDFFWI